MKQILSIIAVCALFACTSSPKSPSNETSMTGAETPDRNVASLFTADLSKPNNGTPGNFTYTYHGRLLEFVEAMRTPEDLAFLLGIGAVREDALTNNLIDTGVDPTAKWNSECAQLMKRPHRTPEGQCYYYNYDPKQLGQLISLQGLNNVGSQSQRFGRLQKQNIANKALQNGNSNSPDLMEPNPSEISQKLFTRVGGKTIEAATLNTLAAAWLQAENHDWFTHGKNPAESPIHVNSTDPLFSGDISIPRTRPDPTAYDRHGYDRTYLNYVTHWWDASHIYGSDAGTIRRVRSAPKCSMDNDDPSQCPLLKNGHIAVNKKTNHLYYDKNGHPITGFYDNWWVGLEMIHSLFALEHNSVCDAIAAKYPYPHEPGQSREDYEDWLFESGRLVISALIAKIHTTEWTPAILDDKQLWVGMYSNWYGMKQTIGEPDIPLLRKWLHDHKEQLSLAVSGLTGTGTLSPYDVPFTLPEEFVAVYRMHPLAPEQITPRNPQTGEKLAAIDSKDLIYRQVPAQLPTHTADEWMYGFGAGHPGAMTLHNYPSFLQHIHAERNIGPAGEGVTSKGIVTTPDDTAYFDIGAVDVLRDRERGIPHYNEFRIGLRAGCMARLKKAGKSNSEADLECPLKPIKTWDDLITGNDPQSQADKKLLDEIYKGDVNKLDLVVGSLAESDRYVGFGFGNTPFWVFALMASRRLMTDPFFHDYFTAAVYTDVGLNWVKNETMASVIARHYPNLAKWLPKDAKATNGYGNAFRPWLPEFNVVKAQLGVK